MAAAADSSGTAAAAIQFIGTEVDAKGNEKFTVNQDAIDYLSSLKGRLAIVSIAGKYASHGCFSVVAQQQSPQEPIGLASPT